MIKLLVLSTLVHATIYGVDDRRPIVQTSLQQQKLAQSVAVLIPNNFMTTRADGLIDVETEKVGETWSMCSAESRDYHQPGFFVGCTGFLIAPDLMVTAGHCMVNFGEARNETTGLCESFTFMFDYQEQRNNSVKTKGLSPDLFVGCEKVIHAVHDSVPDEATGNIDFRQDFALVKLKRAVNRPILSIASKPVKKGEAVTMIGAPLAGPLVLSKGRVMTVAPTYYSATLDSFQGNSGSPVFNSDSEVTGILVRGYPESFVDKPGAQCVVLNRCNEDGSKCDKPDPVIPTGEHVNPISRSLFGL